MTTPIVWGRWLRLIARAQKVPAHVRETGLSTAHPGGTPITGPDPRWWAVHRSPGQPVIRSRNRCVSGSVEQTAVAFIPRVSSTL